MVDFQRHEFSLDEEISFDEDESAFPFYDPDSWSSDDINECRIMPSTEPDQGTSSNHLSSCRSLGNQAVANGGTELGVSNKDHTMVAPQCPHHHRHGHHRHHGLALSCGGLHHHPCEVVRIRQGPVTTPLPVTTVERLNCSTADQKPAAYGHEKVNSENEKALLHPPAHTIIETKLEENVGMTAKYQRSSISGGDWSSSTMAGVPLCRFCHLPGEVDRPLLSPCRCRGSLKYIHEDCLLTWLEISKSKKRHSAPVCELCNYTYHRHRTFQLLRCRFPEVSRQDRVYHTICVLSFLLMLLGAVATMFCFFADRNRTAQASRFHLVPVSTPEESGVNDTVVIPVRNSTVQPNSGGRSRNRDLDVHSGYNSNLNMEEIVTLVSGIVFFLAFFVAMIVQIKSRHTLYQLCVRFAQSSTVWRVLPYDPERDKQLGVAALGFHEPATDALDTNTSVFQESRGAPHLTSSAAPDERILLLHHQVAPQEMPTNITSNTSPRECSEEVVLIMPPGLNLSPDDLQLLPSSTSGSHFHVLLSNTTDQGQLSLVASSADAARPLV